MGCVIYRARVEWLFFLCVCVDVVVVVVACD